MNNNNDMIWVDKNGTKYELGGNSLLQGDVGARAGCNIRVAYIEIRALPDAKIATPMEAFVH